MKSKTLPEKINRINLLSNRNLSIGLAFVLVALIAGIYFLFKPFPIGPSLAVKANPPSIKLPQLAPSSGQKVSPGQGMSKGFMLGGTLFLANPGIKLPQLAASAGQRVSPGQGRTKGFMLGGTLFPANP
jgi:hypothetical protein